MLVGQSFFCPLCAVIHIINLTLVVLLKRMSGRPIAQLLQALASGAKYLLMGKGADSAQARWKQLGLVTIALVAVVMYQWVLIEDQHRSLSARSAFDPSQALAAFESSPKQPIPLKANDPSLGLSGAPVQLVVFSDFQCPACANFSNSLTNLIKTFEGKLQVFFKHYPLGTTCNPSMETDIHPQACEAAEAAEAANRQKKFWAFHDALFASNLNSSPNMVSLIAAEIGLDLHQFEADRKSQTTIKKVESDIEIGNRLGVDATPAIYLNGRFVPDHRLQTIEFLITHELQPADQD
jgi:protein-disulfide isomerase